MYINRIFNLIIVLMFLSMFLFVQPVNAEDQVNNQIEASFSIVLKSATELEISVTADVSQIYLEGLSVSHTSSEIESIAVTDPGGRMSIIQYALKIMLKNQLEDTFGVVDVTDELPTYNNGLFYDNFIVNLSNSFFDLNESVNTYDFITGILDMGAIVNYSFNLQAETGWNNTYTFILGKLLSLEQTYGDYDELTNTVTWSVTNGDGNKPSKSASFRIKKIDSTTHDLESENISIEFILNSKDVADTSLTANILIDSADLRTYNILPDFVDNLNFIPADGFRLFVNNTLLTWDEIYEKTVKPVEEKIKNVIENSSFNQTLKLEMEMDSESTTNVSNPYDTNNMDSFPNIKIMLTDTDVDFKICDISNRAMFGLINAGAEANITAEDINFGDKLNNIGYDYNVTLYLPENIYLDGENIYKWNETTSASGELESDVSTKYDNEKKETIIEIELQTSDLNLLSFLTGKTEITFGIFIQENRNYNVTNISGVFDLPEKILLDNMNSDAFRLCVQENVFSEDAVSDYLTSENKLFEKRLEKIIPSLDIKGKGQLNRGGFDDSIESWDGNISRMSDGPGIQIASSAHCSHPISFDMSFLPPSFKIPNQNFNFTGIENHNVTYRIIFPEGIDISVDDPLNKAQVKTKNDGRKYFEISFNSSEYNLSSMVSCKMVLSGLFITAIFLPCIISMIITIILIIIVVILRKKRKLRGSSSSSIEEDSGGYEDTDYYVPPPPDSK